MSRLGVVSSALALGVLLAASARAGEVDGVSGQPAAPDLAASIQFEALPSCIDEAALEARVARLVRPERLNAARRVEGVVTSTEDGWNVQFRVFEADRLVGRRRLEFARDACEPFPEDVELVLAMLLEGQGFEPPEESPPEAVGASPPPVAGPSTPKAASDPAPKSEREPQRRVKGRFRFGAELALGVLPAPSAALRLEGGVELPIPLAVMLRATWHLDGSIPIDGGGTLDFGGYRLAGAACYLYRSAWVLGFCGGLGFVAIEAAGAQTPGARAAGFDEAFATFGVRLGVPLSRAWSLELGTELEAWFSRPEYVLLEQDGPRVLATASGVPVIGWLALGYDF